VSLRAAFNANVDQSPKVGKSIAVDPPTKILRRAPRLDRRSHAPKVTEAVVEAASAAMRSGSLTPVLTAFTGEADQS
jgi:hypothetical protein